MNKCVHVLNPIIGTVLRDMNCRSSEVKMVKFDDYNTNGIGNILRVLI